MINSKSLQRNEVLGIMETPVSNLFVINSFFETQGYSVAERDMGGFMFCMFVEIEKETECAMLVMYSTISYGFEKGNAFAPPLIRYETI